MIKADSEPIFAFRLLSNKASHFLLILEILAVQGRSVFEPRLPIPRLDQCRSCVRPAQIIQQAISAVILIELPHDFNIVTTVSFTISSLINKAMAHEIATQEELEQALIPPSTITSPGLRRRAEGYLARICVPENTTYPLLIIAAMLRLYIICKIVTKQHREPGIVILMAIVVQVPVLLQTWQPDTYLETEVTAIAKLIAASTICLRAAFAFDVLK